MDKIAFGRRLRKLRECRGLSQDQLGKLTGVTQQQVGFWERGDRGIKLEQAIKVADALGVTVDELVPEENPQPEPVHELA
jgi:transcriptional regulator with XRE-family HTH domain